MKDYAMLTWLLFVWLLFVGLLVVSLVVLLPIEVDLIDEESLLSGRSIVPGQRQ